MPSSASQTKTFWIDLLCWSSAFKAVSLLSHTQPEKIYYVNISRFFTPFVGFLEKTLKVQVEQVKHLVLSEEKLNGISLYETIQMQLENNLNEWVDDQNMAKANAAFCAANDLNPDKFAAHLMEAAYGSLYRPIEMGVLAQYISGKDRAVFIVRRTPLADLIQGCLGSVVFYHTLFAHALSIENRPDYFYDAHLNKEYYSGRFRMVVRIWHRWFTDLMGRLFTPVDKTPKKVSRTTIGVELTQNRVRTDEINDISWLECSGIDMEHVCGLQMEAFDEQSIAVLDAQKIPRYVIAGRASSPQSLKGAVTVAVQRRYLISTMAMVFGMVKCLFVWNENTWLRLQAARYMYRTLYWYSIYEQLGIKVLWTMYDIDEDKLAKGQAMELLGGLYTGGHWSNFPMYRIDNQKCFDVLFTWGEHFLRNNFNRYPFLAIFFTGYPCDHYFKAHRERAKAIRQRYEGKFIISYHDNIMANDLPYSKHMQLDIHRVLISLLRKFENVVVLLKPKRKFVLDEIIKELPELKEMIECGRVEIFLGDTARSKAVPAQIGMASDLVIGLGISTTAAEAFFAGTVSFHADLTGFERNEFANRGDSVVVFRDVFTLEKAVIQRITGANKWKYEDYKGYYMGLDPFMDESSSKRVGYLLKRMREYLAQGVSREDLLPKLSRDYDVYLVSLANWQRMSWN